MSKNYLNVNITKTDLIETA